MTAFENNILKSLTGKPSFEQVSVEELESIAKKYPAFSTAQLLLAKKLRLVALKDDATVHQTQKTALFFANTFWLNHLLRDATNKLTDRTENKAKSEETIFSAPVDENDQQLSAEEEELLDIEAESHEDAPVTEVEEPIQNNYSSNDNDQQLSAEEEELLDIEAESHEDVYVAEVEEPIQNNYTSNEAEILKEEERLAFVPSQKENEEAEEEAVETKVTEAHKEPHGLSATAISETKELLLAADKEPESFAIDKSHFTKDLISSDESEEDEDLEDGPALDMSPELSKVLTAQMAEYTRPIDDSTRLPIEAEPYHTIDYFDSQGIRLDANKPQDVVDKKVRKFTDWLKNMKRHNIEGNDLGTDPEMEQAIQQIAQTSNETKEILTETMAEVYIKQGKILSAINLYKKLSFLNPDKTTYFAAKIKQIKDL